MVTKNKVFAICYYNFIELINVFSILFFLLVAEYLAKLLDMFTMIYIYEKAVETLGNNLIQKNKAIAI